MEAKRGLLVDVLRIPDRDSTNGGVTAKYNQEYEEAAESYLGARVWANV